MANTAANVRVGVTGSVYTAPEGTTLPTSVVDALDGAFVDVGYLSEDGITEAISSDFNDIVAWQNADIVRKVQTSHDYTLQFSMLETNAKSLEVYYGNYTAGPGGDSAVVEVTGEAPYRGAWVFDIVDGDDLIRISVPDGQVTEREDVGTVNGDARQYGVTITCYPDATGVKAYIYHETVGAS